MTKTQKELAFLRELYVDAEWTDRFTSFVDKSLEFTDEENILYINAGTGNHVIVLREKLDKESKLSAVTENTDLLNIARDKAAAVKANINFSTEDLKAASFDAVLADASFVRPADLPGFFKGAVGFAQPNGKIAVFTVAAGSFGEIFSFFWEIFFNNELGESGAEAERLIAELPTTLKLEDIAANAGLKNVETQSSSEIFEYKDGAEFVNSPLVADFLLPVWLKSLNEKQQEKVQKELVQMIDAEDKNLSFRFTVKAVLMTGEKA